MRLVRSASPVLPGVRGTLRAERRTRALLERLRPGDIAVIDHVDLDRATAQAFVDAGVVAVVNAQPMVSGRYPNLGPQVLAAAGITMIDSVGEFGFTCLADGRVARVHDGCVYDGEQRLTEGRVLDADDVQAEMDQARGGLLAQLETFAHNSTELLRREQGVLLHGEGLPELHAKIAGRPVIVVGQATEAELRGVRTFAREQSPVMVAIGRAADVLGRIGRSADVLVVAQPDDVPSAKAVRAARDVIVVGGSAAAVEALDRLGVRPQVLETALTPDDAALLMVHAADPSVIVTAGASATLTDFLEQHRPGMASTYLTRLAVGPTLVDAAAVGTLYSGRVKASHLFLALLICVIAVAAALATTDVGQHWAHEGWHHLTGQWHDLRARMQGRHG
jgi:uncharacterized membrane-anchored protein